MPNSYDIVSYVVLYKFTVKYRVYCPRQITFFENGDTRGCSSPGSDFVREANEQNMKLETSYFKNNQEW